MECKYEYKGKSYSYSEIREEIENMKLGSMCSLK